MRPSGIVTLTTDFGSGDAYVAQLHAVLLAAATALRIVDVSHAVPPGDIGQALFLTESAWPHFPEGTVHVVVVDPGVGSPRDLVAIETPESFLVGPDTGVLSSGIPDESRPGEGIARLPLGSGFAAADIRETALARAPISRTFHGRDLMAPVAAALASGRPLTEVGPPVGEVAVAALLATPLLDGSGEGRVLHVDRFGNAITSFRAVDAPPAFAIEGKGDVVPGPANSYADGGPGLVALPSSSGYIEIALPDGSAAEALGLRAGTALRIKPQTGQS